MIRSEATKDMTDEELLDLQNRVSQMTTEEMKAFVRGFDPDVMGFFGQEGIDENKQESDNC